MIRQIRLAAALLFALWGAAAFAQPYGRTSGPSAAEVLANASPEARERFGASETGEIFHKASGLTCPARSLGLALERVGVGALPNQTGADVAYCEYAGADGAVARVSFAREDAAGPVLGDTFCRGLTKALKLRLGPGALPFNSRILGPAQPPVMATLPVGEQAVPVWRCSQIREPFADAILVFDAAAVRPPGGWTILALHTPKPPPCCASYRTPMAMSFFILPIFMIAEILEAPRSAYPRHPLEADLLRPRPRS